MKEAFVVECINRSQLKEAEYNPRKIDDAARKRLKKSLKDFGLIEPLVWNKRTGNLVSGHQRLSILDEDAKGKDYQLTVSVIDVDEKTEKKINVFVNNEQAMGRYDTDRLFDMMTECGDVKLEDFGFDQFSFDTMFGDNERFDDVMGLFASMGSAKGEAVTDEIKDDIEKTKAVAQWEADRKALRETVKSDFATEYYFVVVCEDDAEKRRLLKKLGVPEHEKYILSSAIERVLNR